MLSFGDQQVSDGGGLRSCECSVGGDKPRLARDTLTSPNNSRSDDRFSGG